MAARDNGEEVRVIRLDAPIRDLVKLAHEFPSSTTDASSGQGATVDARQVRPVPEPAAPDVPKKRPRGVLAKRFQAEAQARAEYFTPGNVVRGYGANYDRVISYNPTESEAGPSRCAVYARKATPGWMSRARASALT
ncbi:hypothetical protein N1Z41_00026540 [Pseudomonas aeruginosa]